MRNCRAGDTPFPALQYMPFSGRALFYFQRKRHAVPALIANRRIRIGGCVGVSHHPVAGLGGGYGRQARGVGLGRAKIGFPFPFFLLMRIFSFFIFASKPAYLAFMETPDTGFPSKRSLNENALPAFKLPDRTAARVPGAGPRHFPGFWRCRRQSAPFLHRCGSSYI